MEKYDYRKLKGRIIEKFDSISNFCEKNNLNKARSGIYTYIKSGKAMPGALISKMIELLDIDVSEVGIYFFTPLVSNGLTKE